MPTSTTLTHLQVERKPLTAETIKGAGLYRVTAEYLNTKYKRGDDRKFDSGAIAIPYPGCGGFTRYRFDVEQKLSPDDEATAKYWTPPGNTNAPYIPFNLSEGCKGNPDIPLCITEGEFKALAACQYGLDMVATPGVWGWKTKDEYGEPQTDEEGLIEELRLIQWQGRKVSLIYDDDISPKHPSYDANIRLGHVLQGMGARVSLVTLPSKLTKGKTGVDDLLELLVQESGLERVRGEFALIAKKHEQWRLPIDVHDRHRRDIVRETMATLKVNNNPPKIFARDDKLLCRVEGGVIQTLQPADLDGHLDEIASFCRVKHIEKDGKRFRKQTPADPPPKVVEQIMAKAPAQMPRLNGVVKIPVFVGAGRLLIKEGYDPETGIYVHPKGLEGVRSDMALEEARRLILDELLVDFPFAEGAHKAQAIGGLLIEPFVRQMIQGTVPIKNVEATTPGSGKGLLMDIAAIISTGSTAPVQVFTGDEAELRKNTTSKLLEGAPLITIDNIEYLDSATLASAITAELWTDRVMGLNKIVTLPNKATWIVTGNNPLMSTEITRRSISIRLDPLVERPELLNNFRHSDLKAWVFAHRADLVSAILAIVIDWVKQGMPKGKKTLGSFRSWAEIIGGILEAASLDKFAGSAEFPEFAESTGFADSRVFLGGRDDLSANTDFESAQWQTLTESWWKAHQDKPVRASDILHVARSQALLADIWADKTDLGATQALGKALFKKKGRVYCGYRIETGKKDGKSRALLYALRNISKTPKTPETPETPPPPSEAQDNERGLAPGLGQNPAAVDDKSAVVDKRWAKDLEGVAP